MRSGTVTTHRLSITPPTISWRKRPRRRPWHRARGKDDLALLLLEFAACFGGTFHQDGRFVYADDRVAISLIRETGTALSGDQFDNLAVYVNRFRPDGKGDRQWTVNLDAEHCEAFWQKNPGTPSKDLSLAAAA
jgi:hypothetical protein